VRDPKTGKVVDERISPPSLAVSEELRLNQAPAGMLLKDKPPGEADDPFESELRKQLLEQAPERGAVIGWARGTIHRQGAQRDTFIAPPGTKIQLFFPSAGNRPEAAYDDYTVVGYFKSGMSEYDSTHVYVPLERLQFMRLLQDEQGRGAVNAIQ